MVDNRTLNERYAEIGAELIDSEQSLSYISDSEVTICYLSSPAKKTSNSKVVYGQCERVADKNKWAIPCDFTITVFEPNVEGFSDEQLKVLIFHELKHIGIEKRDDGTEKYSIVPHDLEDFREVIDRFGVDWDKTI